MNRMTKLLKCVLFAVEVPYAVVRVSILRLVSLTKENLRFVIEECERQRDFETLAWEEEIKTWQELCKSTKEHIYHLLKVKSLDGNFRLCAISSPNCVVRIKITFRVAK